jgi:hypothetical protein
VDFITYGGGQTIAMSASHTNRWLLTFLGLGGRVTCYELDGKRATSSHASLALLELKKEANEPPFSRVRVLATKTAIEQEWQKLEPQFKAYCQDTEVVDLPDLDQLDPDDFLAKLVSVVPSNTALDLVLDLTHGPRQIPFLSYAGLLYLEALRPDVNVMECWFGQVVSNTGTTSSNLRGNTGAAGNESVGKFVNLSCLLLLPRWLYALRLFRERADAVELLRLLEEGLATGSEAEQTMGPDYVQLIGAFRDLARSLAWNCPLDLMVAARKFYDNHFRQLPKALSSIGIPGANELARSVLEQAKKYQYTGEPSRKPKPGIDESTLGVHAELVDQAFKRNDLPSAISLLRELIVSWGWWVDRSSRGVGGRSVTRATSEDDRGLDRGEREAIEWALNSLARVCSDSKLADAVAELGAEKELVSDQQRELAKFWRQVADARNKLTHNGMRPEPVTDKDEAVFSQIMKEWESWKKTFCPFPLRPKGREGTLLISPLGKTPAVLEAAIRLCTPDFLLVVTSETGAKSAESIIEQSSGLNKSNSKILKVNDFMGGVDEVGKVVKEGRPWLARSERVCINLTGGSTLLGYIVLKLFEEAARLSVSARRFILIEPGRGASREGVEARAGGEGESRLVWLDNEDASVRLSGGDEARLET